MKDLIQFEDFLKLDLRVVTILEAEPVPKSDKLLKLKVSLGEETKQIIAGIGKSYDPADLVGQQVVIINNLEPRDLMGLTSEGMILATDGENGPIVLKPDTSAPDGGFVK